MGKIIDRMRQRERAIWVERELRISMLSTQWTRRALPIAYIEQHGRCKDCAHWNREALPTDQEHGGRCQCPKIGEEHTPKDADALVYDYHEGGGFWTGPEFGCVHWMKR